MILEYIYEKACNKCRVSKPLEAFIRDKRTSLGYGMECLDCAQLRLCRKCQIRKPVEEFTRSNRGASGYKYHCKECIKKEKREAYRKDPQKVLRRNNQYLHTKTSRDGRRERMLLREYGMTLGDYEDLLRSQDFKCKICRANEGERGREKLSVDHDHDTGRVRGLLCDPCNQAIGLLLEDRAIFNNAIEYLWGHFG